MAFYAIATAALPAFLRPSSDNPRPVSMNSDSKKSVVALLALFR